MPQYVDLHLHTTCSDGTFSPGELLEVVRKKKLAAFSITDHDTIDGYVQAKSLLHEGDPELIAGLELSVEVGGDDLHLLAYLFDPQDENLNESLSLFQESRNQRGGLIVERLNQQGLMISLDTVKEATTGKAIGRPHIAEVMVRSGMVSDFDEAFRKYIGTHCPAYVPKFKMEPGEAINLVHDAGGVAVLAHPFIGNAHRHIQDLIDCGIDGIEVYHYSHRTHHVKQLKTIVKRYNLIQTGGSDFHGRHEYEGEIGFGEVPVELLDGLGKKAEEVRKRC